MALTLDLGTRIELVPMDAHCHDITLGLYQQGSAFLIHTYNRDPEAAARVDFLRRAACALAEMVETPAGLAFSCGTVHRFAVRRVFLEAAKLATGAALVPKPLTIFDKKSSAEITVTSLGAGSYRVSGGRVEAITGGLKKLAELDETAPDTVAFACGHSHDDLIGLLLPRALNVRAILREEESALTRGVLVAPSAQK